MAETRRRLTAAGLIGLLAILWTVVEGVLPALFAGSYSPYQIVWTRYATHLLLLVLMTAPGLGWDLVRTRRPALQVGRGLLMLAMPACFVAALHFMQLQNVLGLFWLAPLMILALAAWLSKERPGWGLWLAAALGCAGAQLVLYSNRGMASSGAILALGMGVSFSLYVVLTRQLRDERTSTNLFYTAACVFVPLTAAMPLVWTAPSARDALVMAGIGLAGLALLWALDRACELAPASTFAPFLTLQPVVSLFLMFAWTGLPPGRRAIAGSVLILGAALAAWFAGGRSAPGGLRAAMMNQRVTG